MSRSSDMPPDVPSTQRLSLARDIPPDWLDRLLVAHCAIQPGTPLDEALSALLTVAHEVLDDAAIGVRIPDQDGHRVFVCRLPRASQIDPHDSQRLFPEREVEIKVAIPGDHSPTLHLATDDKTRSLDEGAPRLFADRLAQVFGAVIRASRAQERGQTQEIRRLREQMIQLDRLGSLGQMVAGIVHELNNPLTSIVAYAEFLQKKTDDQSDIERLLRISEAARRIHAFSHDLTEYASPRQAIPGAVSIDKVIDQALRFCDHELDQAKAEVKRSLGRVLPVRGVAAQLVQVFVNLFTNAAHAMPDTGGELTVTTQMAPNHSVEIVVTDNGRGIDPESLPRIFEPFFTTKPGGAGTGLGLSIVQRIIADHGGRIQAGGNSPRGTIFRLELPAARPEDVEQADP